jgi:pimeloyl-ACP methyl ester carboxylesterase
LAQLRRNGTGLHYETHGAGAPILLTHGVGSTCRMWDEQVEEFTDRYQLILWDLPGHGQSESPRRTVTANSLTRDILAILNAVEEDRVVLVGLGAGGLIALRFWHEMPDRVRGLVLIGTMPGLRNRPARHIWNGQVEEVATALEQDGLDALEGGAEVDPRLHTCPLGLAASLRGILTQHDEGAQNWLNMVDVPTLIIVGSEDRPNLSAAHHMARTIPNAREIVIPRANHAANIHKAAAVNAAIGDFLGRLPP